MIALRHRLMVAQVKTGEEQQIALPARIAFRLVAVVTHRLLWYLLIPVLILVMSGEASQARLLQGQGLYCEEAIEAAVHATGVPPRLLAAVGLVETGRQDPVTGAWHPWPWTINVEGKGFFFNSKSDAILAVSGLQADGIRSIDVGCMQVNLMQHPDAFATLEEAFDPKHNANYAGRFLNQLFRRSGNWVVAAGWYHSTTPDLTVEYVNRILALLPGGKLNVPGTLGASTAVTKRDIAPPIGRDGMIVPSTRLTTTGLIAPRSVDRRFSSRT